MEVGTRRKIERSVQKMSAYKCVNCNPPEDCFNCKHVDCIRSDAKTTEREREIISEFMGEIISENLSAGKRKAIKAKKEVKKCLTKSS